jgi:hypothetical protein
VTDARTLVSPPDDSCKEADGPAEKDFDLPSPKRLRAGRAEPFFVCFSRFNGSENIAFIPAMVTLTLQTTRNSKAFEVWVVCFW